MSFPVERQATSGCRSGKHRFANLEPFSSEKQFELVDLADVLRSTVIDLDAQSSKCFEFEVRTTRLIANGICPEKTKEDFDLAFLIESILTKIKWAPRKSSFLPL